jgi:hypothetical protein
VKFGIAHRRVNVAEVPLADLARKPTWHAFTSESRWRPIAFELRFEDGYEEAREWLNDAATRDELDHLCQTARVAKNEAA